VRPSLPSAEGVCLPSQSAGHCLFAEPRV